MVGTKASTYQTGQVRLLGRTVFPYGETDGWTVWTAVSYTCFLFRGSSWISERVPLGRGGRSGIFSAWIGARDNKTPQC